MELNGSLILSGMVVAFLATYFYGYHRRNQACACVAAFALNFVGLCAIVTTWTRGSVEDVIIPGDSARGTFIGLLIWALGLLLLWFRFSRTMRPALVYVLIGAVPVALLVCMARWG
jgi:hypothetical protein